MLDDPTPPVGGASEAFELPALVFREESIWLPLATVVRCSNSEMLEIPGGARIIDSPGVRDYAPALADLSQVLQGFREMEAARQNCRFANCKHLREPGCAVKAGVESGEISARRYESYRRLYALTDKLDSQQTNDRS
jgi:putative ribosome biogenesis GTPase RsgA